MDTTIGPAPLLTFLSGVAAVLSKSTNPAKA